MTTSDDMLSPTAADRIALNRLEKDWKRVKANLYMTDEEFKKNLESLNWEYNQVCICGRPYGSLYHETGVYFNHEFVKA